MSEKEAFLPKKRVFATNVPFKGAQMRISRTCNIPNHWKSTKTRSTKTRSYWN